MHALKRTPCGWGFWNNCPLNAVKTRESTSTQWVFGVWGARLVHQPAVRCYGRNLGSSLSSTTFFLISESLNLQHCCVLCSGFSVDDLWLDLLPLVVLAKECSLAPQLGWPSTPVFIFKHCALLLNSWHLLCCYLILLSINLRVVFEQQYVNTEWILWWVPAKL